MNTITDLGQVAITVSDVQKAKHFYADILGLKRLLDPGPNLAFLAAGTVRIMLTVPQGAGEVGKNSVLYFRTDDVEGTYRQLVEWGDTPERAPQMTARLPDHELWLAFVRDPDGILVGLMEERR
jgi:catechol 2,3-dioxygenase-like lactoylglutathione lyase family enzyme